MTVCDQIRRIFRAGRWGRRRRSVSSYAALSSLSVNKIVSGFTNDYSREPIKVNNNNNKFETEEERPRSESFDNDLLRYNRGITLEQLVSMEEVIG